MSPQVMTQAGRQEAPSVDEAPANATGATASFPRASDENLQPGNLDKSSPVLGANTFDLGITDVPAYGFLRWLYIFVQATGGAAGLNNAVAAEDSPWNVLQNIALTEPNGATILQVDNGFDLYLINKLGGYLPPISAEPENGPGYSAVATSGNFSFILRIPVEVSGREGLGALPNQDSAGQFKLRAQIAPSATVYTTGPDTKPVVRVRAWMAAWDQPNAQSGGMANQVAPVAVGTTQFWSKQSGITVNAGNNTIELKRKGNYMRQIIFVLRRAGTSRANGQSDWPAETRFLRDAFPARYYLDEIWRHQMFERTGFGTAGEAAGNMNNGVRFHDYMHEFDGALGRELRDLWQPTRGSTRLEITGSFANAGTLDVLFNDVAIADNVFL